jgi:hypothetical protein
MKPYQSMLLRYVHDPVSGEFANLAVVLFSPGMPLEVRVASSLSRASRFFGGIEFRHLRTLLNRLARALRKTDTGAVQMDFLKAGLEIREITSRVLANDVSSLRWSDAGAGVTESLKLEADRQFERLIVRYDADRETGSRSSEDVWVTFQKRFKTAGILQKLHPVKLETPDFRHRFDHTWVNGCVQIIEPVSLDYEDPDYILKRGSHWLGIGVALQEAAQAHKFTFLLGLPKEAKARKAADKARNLISRIDPSVDFVEESKAGEFALSLSRRIGAATSDQVAS